jgi:hypothetical protein
MAGLFIEAGATEQNFMVQTVFLRGQFFSVGNDAFRAGMAERGLILLHSSLHPWYNRIWTKIAYKVHRMDVARRSSRGGSSSYQYTNRAAEAANKGTVVPKQIKALFVEILS